MEAQTRPRSLSAPGVGSTGTMIWVPGGTFRMGSDAHRPEEGPAHHVHLDSFWIDKTPVTNRQFSTFVKATGHVTFAELAPVHNDYPDILPRMLHAGSFVFQHGDPIDLRHRSRRLVFMKGADWRHPYGPDSNIDGLDDHPVIHVGYSDALIYARWTGKNLPSEAEWEFAARGGLEEAEYAWDDTFAPDGVCMANIGQSKFPPQILVEGNHPRTSPVEAFPPNGYGIHDMIGNVWEWTGDWYSSKHNADAPNGSSIPQNPRGGPEVASLDQRQPGTKIPRKVIKGGSHLCSPNCCRCYRPAARRAETVYTSTSDLGFRCVLRKEPMP